MYTSFFGLNEKPFAITPNPRYLYMSEKHAEALAHLMYGLNEAGGFIQLTGEVGTGKTTVVRTLLEQLPQHAEVALILNPRLTPSELLLTICEELGLFLRDESVHSLKDLVDELNGHLLNAHTKGRRVVVIIDEAQNLLPETLEQVRLLTNLETATHKLLQIILIGQPELRALLARNDLRQLAQRITGRYHLEPLDSDNTLAYIRHRLQIAGAVRELFTEAALREVHKLSHGVPRLINIICDRALLGAYTENQAQVDVEIVRKAAQEITDVAPRTWPRFAWLIGFALVAVVAAGFAWRLSQRTASTTTASIAADPVAKVTTNDSATNNRPEVPEPAKPKVMDTAQVLQTADSDTSSDAAFKTLLGLWGIDYDAGTRACEQAVAHELACVYQKGSWPLLRSLNRPAILQLTDDQGRAHQVVITALDDAQAQLLVNAQTQTVTLASLSRYWTGEFLLLWRPKAGDDKPLSQGMRGDAVLWLRQQLASWLNQPAPGAKDDRYDASLAARVMEFQRSQQLQADGIAGEQTQIALDAAVNSDHEPKLLTEHLSVAGPS